MCKFKDASDNKFIKVTRRLLAEVSEMDSMAGVGIKDERLKDLLKLVPPKDS